MRNNVWLAERLTYVHGTYFDDIAIPNPLLVRFGRSSRTRLGSINSSYSPERKLVSIITLTKYFQSIDVPELVLDATLAHELAHYTHGFHSPHPKQYDHPHRGNVVGKELMRRGAGELMRQQEQWLKLYWREHVLT